MPTTMTYETAMLADAIQKAARVAPNKGAAFDKAAGLLFEVDPNTRETVIKASNLDVTYRQHLMAQAGKGDVAKWRIPSAMLAQIISTLPMIEGSTVDLIDRGDSAIRLSCGRVKLRLATLDPEGFPLVEEPNTVGMLPANDMAAKVAQVAWSVEKRDGSPLSGVRVDGKRLIGCDTYSVAIVPCEVPLEEAVTVPLFLLAPLLKQASDIQVRASDRKLHIMLDAETATTTALIEGNYPQVDRVMRENFSGRLSVHKMSFMDSLNRMLALGRADRVSSLRLEVNGTGMVKIVTFDMEIEGVGRMQDSVDVTTEFPDIFEIAFDAGRVQQAMDACRGDLAHIDFGHKETPEDGWKHPIRISDNFDYQCYVMPKRG
jgi:DNA polymerase III sliding clamp (beta) subunit (PCNA family)